MTQVKDPDEALDAAAQGFEPTSDDADREDEEATEIETIGEAAGIPIPDGGVLGGPDVIERRDAHRWELDPASAEDIETRDP